MKDFRFKPSDILKRKWQVTQLSELLPRNIMVLDCIPKESNDTMMDDKYFVVDLDSGKQYYQTSWNIHQSYSRVG